jgi:phage-related protein
MDEFIWLPDWNAQGDTKADISKVRFGDGYVQRQTKGMNPLMMNWSLAFSPRSDAVVDAIVAFLQARQGVTAFTWTPPGETQMKWTCERWVKTKMGDDVNSLSMTFERVYEP